LDGKYGRSPVDLDVTLQESWLQSLSTEPTSKLLPFCCIKLLCLPSWRRLS